MSLCIPGIAECGFRGSVRIVQPFNEFKYQNFKGMLELRHFWILCSIIMAGGMMWHFMPTK